MSFQAYIFQLTPRFCCQSHFIKSMIFSLNITSLGVTSSVCLLTTFLLIVSIIFGSKLDFFNKKLDFTLTFVVFFFEISTWGTFLAFLGQVTARLCYQNYFIKSEIGFVNSLSLGFTANFFSLTTFFLLVFVMSKLDFLCSNWSYYSIFFVILSKLSTRTSFQAYIFQLTPRFCCQSHFIKSMIFSLNITSLGVTSSVCLLTTFLLIVSIIFGSKLDFFNK